MPNSRTGQDYLDTQEKKKKKKKSKGKRIPGVGKPDGSVYVPNKP